MSKKIAIVTPNLTLKGGAELTTLELAKSFNSDIFTTNYDKNTTYKEFSRLRVYSSTLPWKGRLSLFLKFLKFPFVHKLREYELIITTSGFYPKLIALHNLPPIIHYEQSPTNFKQGFAKLLSPLDLYVTSKIKKLVCNSYHRKKLLESRYKRTWGVIYPPVDVDKFKYLDRGDFFLSVQRITPDKRVEIQIEAFKKLQDEKLIIVGSSCNNKYLAKLKRGAPKNVEFRINVSEEELIELYAKCKATIQTSKGEHFGLVPVESMASGKPCIAVNEGGFRETIIDQKTGILINEPYVDNLIKVIREIDSYHFDPKALVKHAQRFSLERFVDEFKRVIDETLRRSEHSKNN